MLDITGVLVNDELMNYSISTHSIQFQPKGERYWVWMKHHSTKTYTHGGKDSVDLIVPNSTSECWAGEINVSRKVLEYYLAHKSEIETTKDVRE